MGALADALERAGPARVSGAKGLALLAQVAGRRGGGAGRWYPERGMWRACESVARESLAAALAE